MKSVKKIILFFFFLALSQDVLFSQIYPFRRYSIEAGLSESVAHTLLQDERGYIWVGTGNGLNRFDGKTFRQFYEEDGLADNKVNALFQDSRNRIWVGTDAGVSILEQDSLFVHEYLTEISQFPILTIFEDHDGAFWFGTDGYGVWKLDSNNTLFSITDYHGLNVERVRAIDQSKDGTIWIGSREGLVKIFGDEAYHFTEEDGLPEDRIRDVKVDQFDRVWIGSRVGLLHYKEGEFLIYCHDYGLNDGRVHTIAIEDYDRIWVGTESGVSLFDGTEYTNYTRENGLPATIIYASLLDTEGNLWFGTLGGGITIYTGGLFKSFTIDNGLTNNVVTGFAEDGEGNIWIGTYGGGVLRYDGENLTAFGESEGLADNKVYTFLSDSRGRLWVGTRDGISIYENGSFYMLDEERFPFRVVRKIFEDPETGEFWIGTYNDGLIRLTEDGYEQYYTENGFINNTVMDIERDSNGDLWVATYGGAAAFDGNQFRYITIANGLPSNGVIEVHVDHNGDKWFSTFNGPAFLQGDQLVRIIRSNQIETVFYFTVQDMDKRYWFGTNRGIYIFKKDNFFASETEIERMTSYRRYTQNQGLITNELNAGASLLASDGSIWLGTVGGVSQFFPDRLKENTFPPGLEIEEILINGKNVTEFSNSVFQHDQNFLQVSFNGLSYQAPDQVIYEYRLQDFDDDWRITRESEIGYPSLPPGNYRLRIRAYNADGTRSTRTAGFDFKILPPFYFQWWFVGLVIMCVLGLILFSYRYFKINKQVDIEKMRVRIASDLHDDVGSSLTELALQTDFLQAGDLTSDVKETLRQIGEHSRKIVISLDDIVWSIDARNDTAGDLTDRMQDYVNQMFGLGSIEVNYHFDNLNMDEKLPVDVKENIYLIFKEAVNNIVKHSNATKVDILFSFHGKDYELLVRDNGTEIHKNKKTGQGLRNIRMRGNRIGANLKILNKEGFSVCAKGKI